MAHRRISSAEKGKGLDLSQHQPARAARVKAPLPDNSDLIRKHSLTLIGRVTNKTAQKVWNLIPFFTEHWKTEFKPVGSDLGNGLFQFQFELEADLLSVLEQRPYHYARWMVIIQRWEPTISPQFPSLIPFWIKVQGLPVHLWTEETIEAIGRDIGHFEKAEITDLTVRMRVHINGLLPLIKHSVVEYPNGDEVNTTLVYERLDKHCSKCLKLDHELKDCLMAKAEAREAQARREAELGGQMKNSGAMGDRPIPSATSNQNWNGDQRSEAFRFSATKRSENPGRRPSRDNRGFPAERPYKSQSRGWQERTSHRHSSQARERSRYDQGRSSRPPRDYSNQQKLPDPPVRSYYREVSRKNIEVRESGSSSTKAHHASDAGRTLPQDNQTPIPQELLNEARDELRDYINQYTKSADPTEREARIERMRQAEEQGEMEETVVQMARTALQTSSERQRREVTPERIPASQRLGPTACFLPTGQESPADQGGQPPDRIPIALRLGPSPPSLQLQDLDAAPEQTSLERLPVTQRLGPVMTPLEDRALASISVAPKRKPGRPPGGKAKEKKAQEKVQVPKIRRVVPKKNSPVRRKSPSNTAATSKAKARNKEGPPRSGANTTTSSDNRPICNMIPATVKRRMDFRIPSAPGP